MLNFIIGTAGTGKSTHITQTIVDLAGKGEKCLLLVPEQFSKTGESLLFSALDDTRSNLVELYSFTSLLRDVSSNHKKIGGTPLTEAGKAVLARRAVDNVKKMLSLYAKQSGNFGFSFSLAAAFDDLKRSGIDRTTFYTLAQKAPEKSAKLRELALIYSEYSALMKDSFWDSEDMYLELSRSLPLEYTHNTHIFIDGFESFSHGQLKIIEKMLTDAKDVTITLTCDSLYDNVQGTGNFSFVQNTASQLIKSAKQLGINISKPVVMKQAKRFRTNDLKNTDLFLQGYDAEYPPDSHAFVTEFENQTAEVSFVVAKINALVKEGYSYNDITVVCPQLEKYENQLLESFTLAEIPYFLDAGRIISSSAPVVLFRSILNIMSKEPDSENVMPLLRTGLTFIDRDVIDTLENYFYVWQDYDFDLQKEFTMSPSGLKAAPDRAETETLSALNNVRNTIWEIFAPYKNITDPKGSDYLKGCYEIAVKLGCDEKLTDMVNSLENEEDRQLLVRQWDTAISCLDSLYAICGDEIIGCGDIETLFTLMVEGEKIGFAPQTQDCVMITDPKRMKLDAVKAVFIIGVAQDIFPAITAESGLISSFDRQYLKEADYPLKNNFENLFSFENLYYYKALTSREEWLFVSSCKKNIDTRQLPSAQVELLKSGLGLGEARLPLEDYAVTEAFFTDYISSLANNSTRHSYMDILSQLGITTEALYKKQFEIKDLNLLDSVLGNSITISPTGAQSWFQCAFMYFLQRILKVKPLEKAEFDARLAGDYLHYIAHTVMEKYGENYHLAPWEDVCADIDSAVDSFIKKNYPPEIHEDVKFTAQYENMKANAIQLLEYIRTEQADGLFRPVAFEEKIGLGGRVPPLKITAENGKTINVVGVADRVDIYRGQESDYLRIIDYKTGNQKFSLDEVYNGLSSQLLLYMNALLDSGFMKGEKEMKAGAVVYQPADARFKFDKDEEKLYTAVGMALASPEISRAFDSAQSGRYGLLAGDDRVKSLPGSEIAGEKKFRIVLDYVKDEIATMADQVWQGKFDSLPLENSEGGRPCRYCRFSAVCQNTDRSRPMVKNDFRQREEEE